MLPLSSVGSSIAILMAVICSCAGHNRNNEIPILGSDGSFQTAQPIQSAQPDSIPAGAKALIQAYPDHITGFKCGQLAFADGTLLEYDDAVEKDFVSMLDDSDPEDMFKELYPQDSTPAYLSDVGRARCEKLFRKIYGNSAAEVSSRLIAVSWFGQKIRVNSVNGVNLQLEKVAEELSAHPELKPYLTKASTFYWRQVRGARRLSAHSYGIAVDINVSHSDYWEWANPKADELTKIKYKNRIPLEIVRIFEKHGFIWGGRWYHFDTMHFEYRPELFIYKELQQGK